MATSAMIRLCVPGYHKCAVLDRQNLTSWLQLVLALIGQIGLAGIAVSLLDKRAEREAKDCLVIVRASVNRLTSILLGYCDRGLVCS